MTHESGPGESHEGSDWEDDGHSYDRARRASEVGEILSMSTILERLHAVAPGRILDTEFEQEDGHWVYEFKILDPEGRLYELTIDAQDGQVLRRWGGN
jgi:uncharacterized membrane protein YkoI